MVKENTGNSEILHIGWPEQTGSKSGCVGWENVLRIQKELLVTGNMGNLDTLHKDWSEFMGHNNSGCVGCEKIVAT